MEDTGTIVSPKELILRTEDPGHRAVAITDHGVFRVCGRRGKNSSERSPCEQAAGTCAKCAEEVDVISYSSFRYSNSALFNFL